VVNPNARRHRSIHVRFPNAPKGTCRYCGVACDAAVNAHPYCVEKQRAARNYRADAIARSGGVCIDANRGLGPCSGPIEADHPQELIDNGPKEIAVARCRHHHKKATRERAARRREQNRKARPVKKKSSTPLAAAGTKITGATKTAVRFAAGAAIVAAALWWASHAPDKIAVSSPAAPDWVADVGPAIRATMVKVVTFLAVLAGALTVIGACVLAVRRARALRAAEVARIAGLLAAAMRTDPAVLAVRVTKWQGVRAPRALAGRVTYGQAFNDDARAPERARVEAEIARKVVGDAAPGIVCQWWEDRDTMRWRPAHTAIPGARAEEPNDEPEDDHKARVRAQCALLADTLAEGMKVRDKAEVQVTLAGPADAIGPTALRITYPARFRDESDTERARVLDIVHHKMPKGIRWKPDWDTENNVLIVTRRPKMTTHAPAEVPEKWHPFEIPLGVGEDGSTVVWNRKDSPHLLVAGETGSGKTQVLTHIVMSWLAQKRDVIIIDGKGTALAGFRGFAGVKAIGLGEGQDMHEGILAAEAAMRDLYKQVRDEGLDPSTLTPTLVILDEAAEFMDVVEDWWAMEGPAWWADQGFTGKPPRVTNSLKSWKSIVRLGREAQYHLVLGIQQASAAMLGGGTEARDNFPMRISLGSASEQSARMLFGDGSIGRDVPSTIKGRATVGWKSAGAAAEVQMFYCGEMTSLGTPKEGPAGEPIKPWLEALGRPDVETMLQRRIEAKAAEQQDAPPPAAVPDVKVPPVPTVKVPPVPDVTVPVPPIIEPAGATEPEHDWEPVPVTSPGLDDATVKIDLNGTPVIAKVLGRFEEGRHVEFDVMPADESGALLVEYSNDDSILLYVGDGEPIA